MKVFSALLIAVFILFTFSPLGIAQAQQEPEFDFQRAYQDYVFTRDAYNRAHSEYVLAKSQYAQSGTLVAQTRARDATVKMLQARDDVVVTYMTALRMRLLEVDGVPQTAREGLFGRIDAEVAWYADHKSRISSAGTLPDLVADSKAASERFALTERIAYEVLVTVPLGMLSTMREQTNGVFSQIDAKIARIRLEEGMNTSIVERWAFETENKITRSLDKEIETQARIVQLVADDPRARNVDRRSIYNDVILKLEESRQFLRDATSFMREIVKAITTV